MNVLGIVPARGGSKRLPRKNLRRLGGSTLVRRALETAAACPSLTHVVLSTDDPEIAQEAEGLPRVERLERPSALATDTAGAHGVVQHALEAVGAGVDAVVIVQATSPFTTCADIEGTLDLMQRRDAGSGATVVRLDHALQPQKLKLLVADRLVPYLEEERAYAHTDLPELWVRNGSVYVATAAAVAAGTLMTDDQVGYPMPRERSIDINDQLDLAFAEFLLTRQARDC